MDQQTRYGYEKRIKELSQENLRLISYKSLCKDIFEWVTTKVHENETLSQGWLLKQFSRVFK